MVQRAKRPIASLVLFIWAMVAVACVGQVATINTKTGHTKIQKNGVDITPTGDGRSTNPWVFNVSGIPTGSGTDNRIVRWDGTSNLQDSLVEIGDAGYVLSPLGFITGTAAAPVAGTDDYATLAQGGMPGGPFVTISRSNGTYASLLSSLLRFGDTAGGFDGDLGPPTLTADRTWTFPDLTGTVILDTTPFSAASRLHGSGSGGTASLELVAERLLSIDANGLGLAAATEGQVIDFGGGSGAAQATDSPKIGGDTRIYCEQNAQFYFDDGVGSTGLAATDSGVARPAASAGTQRYVSVSGTVTGAGTSPLWLPVGETPADLLGRDWRVTGAFTKLGKDAGDNSFVTAQAVYAEVSDPTDGTADWTLVGQDTTDRVNGTAPEFEAAAVSFTAAAVGNGPLWLKIDITTGAGDIGAPVDIRIYPGACYVTGDTL